MDERIQEELKEAYCGKLVQEDCCLEDEELLEATSTVDEDDEDSEEITITMGIQVEVDEDNMISDITIYFHTSSWGDSGLGEEDPEDYWSYDECYSAAAEFIEGILD